MKKSLLYIAFLAFPLALLAQKQGLRQKYKAFLTPPKRYVCYRTSEKITIDGKGDEQSWQLAKSTENFEDISGEGHPKPYYPTNAKMLWDNDYLYVLGNITDPDFAAQLQQRDTIVYHDNDFEIFIDPTGDGHNYFEIEVNQLGTIFDLSLEKPYRAPSRGFIQFQWNCPGLQCAIHLDGTLNNPNDRDKGWTVEMAIPRKAIAAEFDNYLKAGRVLRIGFSRVEWHRDYDVKTGLYLKRKDTKGKTLPEDNWTWGATGMVAMHMPERWGYVYLSSVVVGEGTDTVKLPYDENMYRFMWMIFYAQEEYFAKNHHYAKNYAALGLTIADRELAAGYKFTLETTTYTYELSAQRDGVSYVINQDGKFFKRQ